MSPEPLKDLGAARKQDQGPQPQRHHVDGSRTLDTVARVSPEQLLTLTETGMMCEVVGYSWVAHTVTLPFWLVFGNI